MGLNLQSDEFWELRPDNFIRMSKAYDLRYESSLIPFRKLMWIVARSNGSDIEESQIFPIHSVDKYKPIEKPIKLTAEEIRRKEEEFKKMTSGNG